MNHLRVDPYMSQDIKSRMVMSIRRLVADPPKSGNKESEYQHFCIAPRIQTWKMRYIIH